MRNNNALILLSNVLYIEEIDSCSMLVEFNRVGTDAKNTTIVSRHDVNLLNRNGFMFGHVYNKPIPSNVPVHQSTASANTSCAEDMVYWVNTNEALVGSVSDIMADIF